MPSFPASEGRRAFGADPANYDRARPDYPPVLWDVLREQCGLRPCTRTFEVGAGTGRASRHLLGLGADPLVSVEPDERLATYMREQIGSPKLTVIVDPFEDADLGPELFHLGVAATSFHWVEERSGLAKVARLIETGGWWAMWFQVFGDPEKDDPFYTATNPLLSSLPGSPSGGQAGRPSYALDSELRVAALEATGAFKSVSHERWETRHVLDPEQVRRLYSTFSDIGRLPEAERMRILDGLEAIARDQFHGRVERAITTALYLAQRT